MHQNSRLGGGSFTDGTGWDHQVVNTTSSPTAARNESIRLSEFANGALLALPDAEAHLRLLYTAMTSPYIVADVYGEGKKHVLTEDGPLVPLVVQRHLAEVGTPLHRTFGVSPSVFDAERGWLTHFLVVDLDDREVEPLHALGRYLDDFGVPSYLSRSTTGRGWHLVVFLVAPVPSAIGAQTVRHLITAARRLTPTTPEKVDAFPSGAEGGNRVLLPYRGASIDGFGFNPLMVAKDMDRVRLDRAHLIGRAPIESIAYALLPFEVPPPTPPSPDGGLPSPAEATPFEALRADDDRIERERTRLARHYVEGKRQDLALGFAGYMAMHRVSYEDAARQVRLLSKASGEAPFETEERLGAVKNTYARLERGERVAYRAFYERAGVEPPTPVRQRPIAVIASVLHRALAHRWQGNGGYTDFVVLISLAAAMSTFGRRTSPTTGEIGMSCRSLALATNAQPLTVSKSLRRLTNAGWIERAAVVAPRAKAFTYRFVADGELAAPTPTQSDITHTSILGTGALEDCVAIVGHSAFHQRALGPKAAYVACLLRMLGPKPLADLNAQAGQDLATTIRVLVDLGVVWHSDARFALVERWNAACDDVAAGAKSKRYKATKGARIALERAQFHKTPTSAAAPHGQGSVVHSRRQVP